MILHEIDVNSTWIESTKNKIEGEMILARRRALEQMKAQGLVTTHQVTENEISTEYRLEIKKTSMTYQIVPPDDHHCNLAEKSIQTWKVHFIGVMSRTAEIFPAHHWCQVIPQEEHQLLFLQKYNVNPKISVYAYVYGTNDYNSAQFVPIGMETLVYDKPKIRGNFAEHCSKVFVLRTAFEHYCSWIMWIKETRATRILATVFHKKKCITNQDITPEDRVIAATGKLADALKGYTPPHLSETTLDKLKRIGTILKHERTHMVQPNLPRIPPNPPPPPHQTHYAYIPVRVAPTPTTLSTPLTSSTVPPPRVSPPTVAPPTRVVTPPTEAHQIPLSRPPQMADQRSKIEDEVYAPAHNTQSHKHQRSSLTQ